MVNIGEYSMCLLFIYCKTNNLTKGKRYERLFQTQGKSYYCDQGIGCWLDDLLRHGLHHLRQSCHPHECGNPGQSDAPWRHFPGDDYRDRHRNFGHGSLCERSLCLAPGMGLNAMFTYTICKGMGFAWQEALGMVFICGLINIIITVTKIRK